VERRSRSPNIYYGSHRVYLKRMCTSTSLEKMYILDNYA